jgi:flagellin-like protein
MNYPEKIRKIQNNAKALSPVVASIILIAVTVAVSIAVAAWMGGLATNFMQTEELKITNVQFKTTGSGEDAEHTIVISVSNTGTIDSSITSATVNGATADPDSAVPIAKNDQGTVTLTFDWESGDNYQITLTSAKGTSVSYTKVA